MSTNPVQKKQQYNWTNDKNHRYQFSSVAQSCLTPCNPVDCSTPGFPVYLQLPKLAQTMSIVLREWSHPIISSSVISFSSCLQSFPASRSFQMTQFFPPGGKSIGVSVSTLVLPKNTQWSSRSLDWTQPVLPMISFRMDWLHLLTVQGTLKCLLQHHSSKASILYIGLSFL